MCWRRGSPKTKYLMLVTKIQGAPKVLLGIPSKCGVSKHLSLKQHPYGWARPKWKRLKERRQPVRWAGQFRVVPESAVEWLLPQWCLCSAGYMTTRTCSLSPSELKIQTADNPEWGVERGGWPFTAPPGWPFTALLWPTDRRPSTRPSTQMTGQKGWATGVFPAVIRLILV